MKPMNVFTTLTMEQNEQMIQEKESNISKKMSSHIYNENKYMKLYGNIGGGMERTF